MFAITLLSITCEKSSSGGFGNDDLYVAMQVDGGTVMTIPSEPTGDRRWGIDPGATVALQPDSELVDGSIVDGVNFSKPFRNDLVVELWDYDTFGHDSLGKFTAIKTVGIHEASVSGSDAMYKVGYQIDAY